jgi:lysophospholipase L1-like esterase
MTRSHPIALGFLIPCVIALGLTTDFFTRFLPTRFFSFRAWEAVRRYPTSDGPFTPNASYRNDHSCGDLATRGNIPAYRVYRPETFSTDAFGFRKNPGEPRPTTSALLIGDSFAAGSSVNDDETLAVQLENLTSRQVYNAGFMDISSGRLLRLAERLHMTSGIVIFEYMESTALPTLQDVEYDPPKESYLSVRVRGLWHVSPLQILSRHLYQKLLNNRALPNNDAHQVIIEPLKNGQPMLFLQDDAEKFNRSHVAINLAGILKLQQELFRKNLNLLVVLAPNKCSVYADLLARPPGHPSLPYLDQLEKALEALHVPVVNLLPALQNQAASNLSQNQYVYWFDDTHWNALGIQRAAQEIQNRLVQFRDF